MKIVQKSKEYVQNTESRREAFEKGKDASVQTILMLLMSAHNGLTGLQDGSQGVLEENRGDK